MTVRCYLILNSSIAIMISTETHSKFRFFANHNSDRVQLKNEKKTNIFINNYYFIKVETLFILYFDCGSKSLSFIEI